MILHLIINVVLICLGCYVGIHWQRRQTLHEGQELAQDYQRMHDLTDRTVDVLARIDPEIVTEANEEILAEEGAALLETLEEETE